MQKLTFSSETGLAHDHNDKAEVSKLHDSHILDYVWAILLQVKGNLLSVG